VEYRNKTKPSRFFAQKDGWAMREQAKQMPQEYGTEKGLLDEA
jgi:hypothetical protein